MSSPFQQHAVGEEPGLKKLDFQVIYVGTEPVSQNEPSFHDNRID